MIINRCLICSERIPHKDTICHDCRIKLDKSRMNNYMTHCPECGYPLLNSLYKCDRCELRRHEYIASCFDYGDFYVRDILERYKFRNERIIAKFFAEVIKSNIAKDKVIVPVPSSFQSIKSRGWDQMKEICRYLKKYEVQFLIKQNPHYNSSEQKKLNKKDRLVSATEKFRVVNSSVSKNKSLVVIDDVTTTGATMIECISLLKNNGYKDVSGFTLFCDL